MYGGWSRGFRSGGFNQTGVGAVADANGVLGVNDLFNAEVADTLEVGAKGEFFARRLNAGLSLYKTKSTNGYFFVFLAANSTQNLGNLDADYKGAEFELNARLTDRFDLYASFGYTDSEITGMEDPTVIGNEAPLVSRTTLNFGAQYRQPVKAGLDATFRVDFQHIGRTWWEPYNTTSRDPVDLLDAAPRARKRQVGGHGLVEESHRQEIQRRILAGRIPVQRIAATLRASNSATSSETESTVMASTAKLPSRLHHTAYVTNDLEATRKFYEDIIGLPLLATWCEKDDAVRRRAHLLPLLLRARRRRRARVLPVREARRTRSSSGRRCRSRRSTTSR